MVNAAKSLAFLGAAIALGVSATTPSAQTLPFESVLEDDAVQVMASQWPAATARCVIPPRSMASTQWPAERAQQLLEVVMAISAEGLDPADYRPDELRAAILAGEGDLLDNTAGAIFTWLVQDLRDGRTPVIARRNYLMDDPDAERLPVGALMECALATGDVAGVLESINPSHKQYAALRAALAATPITQVERRNAIRANMDRWRWLPRDLGGIHLLVNVPEFMLRLNVNGETMRSYRTIVGTPGRNATPQMSEMVEGVIFNPNWTVPQSIVVGEGLGRRVLNNPVWARSMGYTASRGANGYVSVVQQPGPRNALGLMKLDMPNAHAIFLHDTPNRNLFERDARALSHGCVRVEDAMELAVTLALLGEGTSAHEAMRYSASREYTKVPLQQQVPVYLSYFTMRVNEAGELEEFADLYSRDAPVLAALAAPSQRRLLMVAGL